MTLKRVHFKFTTYSPLLRRGKGEAKEICKFEMYPFKNSLLDLLTILRIPCLRASAKF
jgi:hypothetical protein